MVTIYYTCFDSPLEGILFNNYLKRLPSEEQFKNAQYKHWQDKHRHLLSRLLLIHISGIFSITDSIFPLKRNKNGKPYSDRLYFNISHSGNFVAVAFSEHIELGLDIQKIADIPSDDFDFFLTAEESKNSESSSRSSKSIADLWSMKEAVAKGIGKGILLPFSKIHIENHRAFIESQEWFLKKITLNSDYACWVATPIFISEPESCFIDIRDFSH